tara:strand:- start:1188 stop:1805 length:618 start_codon:yes stop_codon:yes gene_type:complete
MRKKLKFKKLLNEYRSLAYELEYVQEVLLTANHDFNDYYREFCDRKKVNVPKLENENRPKVDDLLKKPAIEKEKIDQVTRAKEYDHKLIFREIARKLHPDKLAPGDSRLEEFEEAFKKANDALETGKWGNLFDVAEKYDIDIKEYDEVNKSIKEDIKRLKALIQKEKTTYAWKLFNCEDSGVCKDNVIKQFLKHLFNYSVNEIVI